MKTTDYAMIRETFNHGCALILKYLMTRISVDVDTDPDCISRISVVDALPDNVANTILCKHGVNGIDIPNDFHAWIIWNEIISTLEKCANEDTRAQAEQYDPAEVDCAAGYISYLMNNDTVMYSGNRLDRAIINSAAVAVREIIKYRSKKDA